MIEIYVDADACPVKDEVYRVAGRYDLPVLLVASARMSVPPGSGVAMIAVGQGPDAADNWIAEHVGAGDVVVTADIPLAARCLQAGARVLGNDGRAFTEDSIGAALATRELKSHLRQTGVAIGGPRPLAERDRSRFASTLDQLARAGLRDRGGPPKVPPSPLKGGR